MNRRTLLLGSATAVAGAALPAVATPSRLLDVKNIQGFQVHRHVEMIGGSPMHIPRVEIFSKRGPNIIFEGYARAKQAYCEALEYWNMTSEHPDMSKLTPAEHFDRMIQ